MSSLTTEDKNHLIGEHDKMEFFRQKAKYTFPLYFWSKGAVSDFQQSLLRRSITSQASTKKQRVRNNNISPEEAITSILTKHPKNPYQGS